MFVAYALVLLLHRELFFKHVPGANDNAAGVAVMLSLAEALALDAPADTEVVAVATGCEESGMWGMQNFLTTHKDELQRAWLINIDNVGAGEVFYTDAEGMLLRHHAGREVMDIAQKAGHAPGLHVVGHPFTLMSTDAEPALLRGYDAISVMAARDGIPVNWHWESDTYDRIDPDTVDTAYRFLEAMVRRLIALASPTGRRWSSSPSPSRPPLRRRLPRQTSRTTPFAPAAAPAPPAPCDLTWPLPMMVQPSAWMDHHYPTRTADGVMARYDGAANAFYDGHRGLDLPVADGTRVLAAADGVVVWAALTDRGGYSISVAPPGAARSTTTTPRSSRIPGSR